MHKRRKLLYFGLGAVLVILILLVALLPARLFDRILCLEERPHLSDSELIANFYQHRAEFERLRNMIVQDKGLLRVNNDRTLPEDAQSINVPPSRIKEYRELLTKLDIRGGIEASSDRRYIGFIASLLGWATHNSEKGYAYTEELVKAQDIVDDLDHFKEHEVGSGMRRIEGDWYLFYEGY
ncbi:MAG: hypothetical protein ACYC7L_07635 [Nitrospirota bacterium]